jgi:Protein of unknown function (DUF1549)/Protein of unknown function (DUF1553)
MTSVVRRVVGRVLGIGAVGLSLLAAPIVKADEPPASPVTSINAAVRQGWESGDVKPSARATDAEFLRRAYLDLLGRIPSLKESIAYLESKEPGKNAKLVNYLLEHPDFSRNFGNVWTVLLIGRGDQGREVNRAALRSWLRVQFGRNRPWNEIVNDLITASGPNDETNGAVNFVLAHREFDAVPLTSVTTRVFLGEQIQCTQCHDHPSNNWKQADFWGINAFFRGLDVQEIERTDATGAMMTSGYELIDNPSDAYAKFDRRDGTIRIVFPTYLDGSKISQGTDVHRRQELGKFITDAKNKQFARAFANRMWGYFLGRGIVHPVDDFGDHNPPSNPELLEQLATAFESSGYDVKALIRLIMATEAYGLSSKMTPSNDKDDTLFSHMALKPMTPEQLFESLLVATAAQKAGGERNSDQRREQWLRQFVFNFANDETQEGSSFQGTIPQALMMMNGDLMEEAVSGKPGSFLAGLLEEAKLRGGANPEGYVVTRLYLAALSRPPSHAEMAATRNFLNNNPDAIGVVEDLFWALLNSNEFVLNH